MKGGTGREVKRTAPERIRDWVARQLNPKHVDRVWLDLVDVAAGNREGSTWERAALARIFPEWQQQ
jgi:hypothetical protein